MAYEISYSENPFGVITKFSGVVTNEDLNQSCLDRLSLDERIKNAVYILDDFLEVIEIEATSEGVQKTASFAIKASKLNKELGYLSIVPNELLYGMSRMWQAYTDDTGWERNIVRTREEAKKYVSSLTEKINTDAWQR